MDRIHWIRDLVKAEEQMEETGVVDFSAGVDREKILLQESTSFLNNLKNQFIEASVAFNELKASALGRLKIYGIAKTQADFMLFRNGFKMIFSLRQPGSISIRFNFIGPNQLMPSQIPNAASAMATNLMEETLLYGRLGAFGDIQWTYNEQPIKSESIVRYYMSLFIKESAK